LFNSRLRTITFISSISFFIKLLSITFGQKERRGTASARPVFDDMFINFSRVYSVYYTDLYSATLLFLFCIYNGILGSCGYAYQWYVSVPSSRVTVGQCGTLADNGNIMCVVRMVWAEALPDYERRQCKVRLAFKFSTRVRR